MSMHTLIIAASVACRALLGIQVASFASLYVCVERLRLKRKYLMILLIDKLPTRFMKVFLRCCVQGESDWRASRSNTCQQKYLSILTNKFSSNSSWDLCGPE